jgi:nitrogen fixation NifU-like protein
MEDNHLNELYQETILEHNKHPQNFHKLDHCTHCSHGKNPLCGDDYTIYLDIKDGIIKDVGFEGHGCAISKSSASILTTSIKGKTVKEALDMKDNFLKLVTESCDGNCAQCLGKLKIFEGVKKYPVRVKCATLIWRALEDALVKPR